MAELADAPDLGSGVHDVGVRVPFPARKKNNKRESLLVVLFLRTSTYICTHLRKKRDDANTTRINEKQERDIGNDADGITGHSEKKNLA